MKRKTFQAAKETIEWVLEHKVRMADSDMAKARSAHNIPEEDQDEFYQALLWISNCVENLTLEEALEMWGEEGDYIEEEVDP